MKEFPKWFIDMMQDFLDMRDAQKEYFRQPSEYKLKVSKAKESKADNHINDFISRGYISQKEKPKDTQATLFGS